MSSITFDATLKTDKLESSIAKSKKNIKDWAKDVEDSGNRADRSFNKVGLSLRDSIRYQKEYIKGLTAEIKQMQAAYDSMAAGAKKTGKGGLGEQLGQAKRSLSEATRELTALEEEYGNTGVEANEKITKSTSGVKAAWLGIVAAIGSAMVAFRFLKKEVLESEVGLNRYNTALGVMKQLMYDIVHRTGKESGIGFIKEWIANIKNAAEVQNELNELRIQERKDLVAAKEHQVAYNQYLYDAKEQTKSLDERINAYDAALESHNKNIDTQKKITEARLAEIQKLLTSESDNTKLLDEEAELQLTLLDLENRRWSAMKEISSMRSGLIKTATEEELKIRNELELAKIKGIDKELLALQQKYEADLESYKDNEAIKSALTEKYALDRYEIEMKYLDKIKDENRKAVDTLLKLDPGKGSAILKRALTKAPSPLKGTIQTREDIDKQRTINLEKEKDLRSQILDEAILFTQELAEQLNLSEEQTVAIEGLLRTVSMLVQGNFIGAAFSILSKVLGVFSQNQEVMSEPKWKKQIEAWDALIERQQRVIELSQYTGGTEKALKDAIELAQKELDLINAAILEWRERSGRQPINEELLEARRDAIANLEDAQQALDDFLTGGISQIDIAGILAQGFEDGKKSAKDFTDDFNELMRNAINSSLEELSKPSITAWYQKFAADMESAGGLDADEIVALKQQWDSIVEAEKARREQIYAIAGITDRAIVNEGLTGQIRREITEETGTELAGLFRRFADEQRVVKDYSIMGVGHLVGIESNTAETVNQLQLAITELQSINNNTKQVAVAGLG